MEILFSPVIVEPPNGFGERFAGIEASHEVIRKRIGNTVTHSGKDFFHSDKNPIGFLPGDDKGR